MGFFTLSLDAPSYHPKKWTIAYIQTLGLFTFTDDHGFVPDHVDLLSILQELSKTYEEMSPELISSHNEDIYNMAFSDGQADRVSIKPVGRPSASPLKGFVYLIRYGDSQYHKIGFSSDPSSRLKALQRAIPETLVLVHSIKTNDMLRLERFFHEKFNKTRIRSEWFELSPAETSEFLEYGDIA